MESKSLDVCGSRSECGSLLSFDIGNLSETESVDLNDEDLFPSNDEDLFSSDDSEYDLEDHPFEDMDSGSRHPANLLPPYPHGPVEELECWVCFEDKKLRRRICCNLPVCDDCVEMYLITQINQGIVKMECLKTECSSYIHRDEILARLPLGLKDKFYKLLVDANKDPHVKTCPRCSHVLKLSAYHQLLNKHVLKLNIKRNSRKVGRTERRRLKDGIKVECPKCELDWCFPCHAPWHEGVTCKQYRKGDKLVGTWANEFHYGQPNAQKCPKCKIFVERTTGCDHMTCSQCRTNFCYRCGDRYWGMKLLGDHFSRFSPFGCKYNFMPERPGPRRFIRGAVLGGKLLGGVVLAGLAVAAGVTLLGLSVVVLPAIGGYKYHARMKRKRMLQHFWAANQLDRNDSTSMTEHDHPYMDELYEADVVEDVEDVERNFNEWVVLGMEVPDSQEVEVLVLVHKHVNADGDEHTVRSEVSHADEMGTVVTITDMIDVKEEGGYTRTIAHIVSTMDADENNQSSDSSSQSESRTSTDSTENVEIAIGEQTAKNDTDSKLVFTSKDVKISEDKIELNVKENNGCFANIFSKKLNSLQHTAHDLQQSKFPANPKSSLKRKSGTWEKRRKKEVLCSNSLDLKSLSAIQTTTSDSKADKSGQDHVSAVGRESGDETDSPLTVKARNCSSEESKFCEKCGCAPVGHAYPCDIVTYL